MTQNGSLIVLSGFAGVGKGTVLKIMMANHDGYAYSVSATTRAPRPGEKDGVDYFFKTKEEFERMIGNHELAEYAQYVGNYYGTPLAYAEKMRAEGKDVILEIDIQGAMQIRRNVPDAVLIFVMPPSAETLKERLIGRGTETQEVVARRLSRAAMESEGIGNYDYIVVNDDAEICAEQLHQLIASQRLRTAHNLSFIKQIQTQMQSFRKGE